MSLTEIIGGQEIIYSDEQMIPHTEWGKLLFVPDATAKSAIRKSNSQIELVRSNENTVRRLLKVRASTPARDLPRILVELAKLKSANGPSVYYGELVKSIDLSKDFSFKTPRGTVVFKYPTPLETETAAE